MKRSCLVVAMVMVGLVSAAQARSIKLDADGLSAWVPDQWKVDSTDTTVTALAPAGTATALFLTQQIRDLDVAYKNVPAVMKAVLPTIQYGQPQRVSVAGLSAILIRGSADVTADTGPMKIEANIVVVITPGQRALYLITLVEATSARSYDTAIQKILSSVAVGGGTAAATAPTAPAAPAAPKANACWEMKSQPNGWSKQTWNGVSFVVPRGWTATPGKNPDTDEAYLQVANTDGDSILVFAFAAAAPNAAWQALAPQLHAYELGDVAWGEVVGQRALCAKGSASDAVMFHRGSTALVMLGRAASDPSAMRGVLGSMRWK